MGAESWSWPETSDGRVETFTVSRSFVHRSGLAWAPNRSGASKSYGRGLLRRDGWPGCACGDRLRAGSVSAGATAVSAVSLALRPIRRPMRSVGRSAPPELLAYRTTGFGCPRRRTQASGVRLAAIGPAHVASWPGHLPGHEWITTACRELLLGARQAIRQVVVVKIEGMKDRRRA